MKESKLKKAIIISVIILLVILVIVGIVFFIYNNKKSNNKGAETESIKVKETYEKVVNSDEITFITTLDDQNKDMIIIKNGQAYKEVTRNGITYKYIVKDENTYFLDESNKVYYTYKNNTSISTEIEEKLEKLKEMSSKSGKEKINGKNYHYEEFEQYQDFLINNKIAVTDLTKAKTRIYYDNDKIVYIKTIAGDEEEILKVEISYGNVNDDYFNIPSDYKDGDM